MKQAVRVAQAGWRALGSRRLPALLLSALAAGCAVAGLFPQAPDSPEALAAWLPTAAARYGGSAGLLRAAGLFDTPRAPWLIALLAALLVSALACTVQRGRRAQSLPTHAASIAGHLAAAVLLAAVLLQPFLARQESGIIALPGQAPGPLSGLQARAATPNIELYPNGQLRDVSVALALPATTGTMTRTVHLNQPIVQPTGPTLHLQGTGRAVEVSAPEGTFCAALVGSPPAIVQLPQAGLSLRLAAQPGESDLFLEAFDARSDPPLALGSGTVGNGRQIQVGDVTLTVRLTGYTLWQVSRDKTFGWAAGAGALLLAAALAALWLPSRRGVLPGAAAVPETEAIGPDDARAGASGAATWPAAALAVALAGWLVGRGLRAGHWPLGTPYELALAVALATSLAAAAAGAARGGRSRSTQDIQWLSIGLAVALILVVQLGLPAAERDVRPLAPALRSPWFPLHAGAAALAYGALGLAGAGAVAWLLRPGGRAAARRIVERGLAAGYPLLTLSLVLGMLWAHAAWGRYWGWDLKEKWTLATWLIVTLYWHLRRRPSWQGRPLAWLVVVGLAAALVTFLGTHWLAGPISVEGGGVP